MRQTVYEYMLQYHMVEPGDILWVAISGGADSVSLLCICKELESLLKCKVKAIHVEHGIRGAESLQDADFVKRLCEKLNVPLTIEHVDVPGYSKEEGLGVEEAARILRYRVFETLSSSAGSTKIALAHHSDDQAETVLFQMSRGTGLKGLCGMQPVRIDEAHSIHYLRPLLSVSRKEIETYLERIGQDYCIDSTNVDTHYSRNDLRKNILPALERINPMASEHIAQTAARLAEVESYMELETDRAFSDIVVEQFEFENLCAEISLSIRGLQHLHQAIKGRVIRKAIAELTGSLKDIEAVHINHICQLTEAEIGKVQELPYWMKAYRDTDVIVLMKVPTEELYHQLSAAVENPEFDPIPISKEMLEDLKNTGERLDIQLKDTKGTMIRNLSLTVHSKPKGVTFHPKNFYTKQLDYDKIKSGFTIRSRREGDWICLDANGNRKNIGRLFIDAKVPEHKRGEIPLLAGEEHILAVLGHQTYEGRVSADMYLSENTEFVLEIKESKEET